MPTDHEFDPDSPEWGEMNKRRYELIRKKVYESLNDDEHQEYERLQKGTLEALQARFPKADFWDLDALRMKLES